jgi:hypothetical protein
MTLTDRALDGAGRVVPNICPMVFNLTLTCAATVSNSTLFFGEEWKL